MANQNIVEVYFSLHIVLCRRREAGFYALFSQRNRHFGSEFRRMNRQFYLVFILHFVYLLFTFRISLMSVVNRFDIYSRFKSNRQPFPCTA